MTAEWYGTQESEQPMQREQTDGWQEWELSPTRWNDTTYDSTYNQTLEEQFLELMDQYVDLEQGQVLFQSLYATEGASTDPEMTILTEAFATIMRRRWMVAILDEGGPLPLDATAFQTLPESEQQARYQMLSSMAREVKQYLESKGVPWIRSVDEPDNYGEYPQDWENCVSQEYKNRVYAEVIQLLS